MKHKTKQTLSEILRPQTVNINYSGVNKNSSPRMSRLHSSNFAGSLFWTSETCPDKFVEKCFRSNYNL
jgi:hypothetical protein